MKRIVAVLAFLSIILTGCGSKSGASSAKIAEDETLVLRLSANPVTLNPVSAVDGYANTIHALVLDTLIEFNSNLEPIPCMAKSWNWSEKTENGKKKYILTFKLRDNIYWHDGVKFTAQDMVYTYNKIMDPLSKAQNKVPKFEGLVEKVSAPDDYTFVVVYNKPFAPAVATWEIYPLPKHIYEKEDFHKSPYNRAPLGTGPYRVTKWETSKIIKLERVTNYWRNPPHFQYINYLIIQDDNVSLSAFKRGDFDIFGLEPEQYLAQTNQAYFTNDYKMFEYMAFGFSQIAWNCDTNSIFNDPKVRRAMTYALDREALVSNVLKGFAKVSSAPFFYGSWAYNHQIQPFPFDLKKAKQLLAESGWTDSDGDGVLDKDGHPFRFEIIFGNFPLWSTMAVNMQENLKKIGVEMEIRTLEWAALSQRMHERNFDAVIFAWSLDYDPDPFDIFHSSQITNGLNYGSYRSPEADRLMEQGRTTYDQKKRQKIYYELHRVFHEDQPYTLLFSSIALVAAKKEIKGIHVSPAGIGGWYPGLFDWHKERGQKKAQEKP